MMAQPHVFLCHNSRDKLYVRLVAEALRARGISPWMDQLDLRAGDEWRGSIEETLDMVGSAIVFLGSDEGSIQKAEISRCLTLAGQKRLRLIPAILPHWPEGKDFSGLIARYSGVSFNVAAVDPITELCRGIQDGFVEPSLPVAAIAPTSTDFFRERLITYCHNARVLVPRAGIYPQASVQAEQAFVSDLERSQLLVHRATPNDASMPDGLRSLIDRFHPPSRVIDFDPSTQFPAAVGQKVVEQAKHAFELPPPEKPDTAVNQSWLAMVKYCADDGEPNELVEQLSGANVICMPTDNGLSMVDTFREFPFQAVIVVLGEGSPTWKMDRGKELLTVVLKCKDSAPPLTVYYHRHGKRGLPPLTVPKAIEIDGPGQLPSLIERIQQLGGVQ